MNAGGRTLLKKGNDLNPQEYKAKVNVSSIVVLKL